MIYRVILTTIPVIFQVASLLAALAHPGSIDNYMTGVSEFNCAYLIIIS
ncbi:hypothetical protein [Photorhabdus bodei]|nr:hypothetical protein [Photorhabdus bodei]MCC8464550.1 hypothetical protein [Photorhabdus bodei]